MHTQKIIRPWTIWLVAGLFYAFEFIHRLAPGAMVSELIRDFEISKSSLGTLSAFYFYTYALFQIPVGLIVDKWGTRIPLSLAALSVGIGSYLFAASNSFYLACFSRGLIGFGSAFAFISCLKLASVWFPASRFALIVGLTNLLGAFGAHYAGKEMAIAVEKFGWVSVLNFSGHLGLIFTLILLIFIKDKNNNFNKSALIKSNSKYPETDIIFSVKETIKSIFSNNQVVIVSLFACLLVIPIITFSEMWETKFLEIKYSIDKVSAFSISNKTFIGIAFGGPIIGLLSDRFGKRKPLMLIGAIGALICTLAILYAPKMTVNFAIILQFLFGFFTSSMLLCFSICRELTPKWAHGTGIAFVNMIIVMGSALFQPVVGKIMDILSINSQSLNYDVFLVSHFQIAFIILPICQILAIVLWFFIKETNCFDC